MRRQIVRFKMSRLSGIEHELARSPPATPCRSSDNYDVTPKKNYMPKKTREQDDNKWFDPENFPSSWKRSLFDHSDNRGPDDSRWDLWWSETEGLKDNDSRRRDEKSCASSKACDTTWSLSDEENWDSFDSLPQSEIDSNDQVCSLDYIKEETFEQIWSPSDDDMSNATDKKISDLTRESVLDKSVENIFVQEQTEEEDLFSREGEKEGTISLLSKIRNGKVGRFVKIFGNNTNSKRKPSLFKRRNKKFGSYYTATGDMCEREDCSKRLDPLTLYAPLNDDDVPFDEI